MKNLPLAGRYGPARPSPRHRTPRRPGQNFLYDPATGKIRSLDDRELFRRIAISYRICRIYAVDNRHNAELAAALDRLLGDAVVDDVTNM